LAITVIAVAAICLGFLADLIITCFEKNAYPQDYAEYVTVYAEKYGVPEELVYAVIRTESDFDSGAVSSAGAVGLMQLMPQTFKWLTDEILFEHMESGMIYDPETNIRYGTYYLSRLYDRYGNWEVALAAYNGGPGNVDKWLENDRYADGEGGLKRIPFRETRHFVVRVTDAWDMYERLYG
jgi:soluble lytic murein transglycosylase